MFKKKQAKYNAQYYFVITSGVDLHPWGSGSILTNDMGSN